MAKTRKLAEITKNDKGMMLSEYQLKRKIKDLEKSLNDNGLIDEAIEDIILIAKNHNPDKAKEMIKKQFLPINKQDIDIDFCDRCGKPLRKGEHDLCKKCQVRAIKSADNTHHKSQYPIVLSKNAVAVIHIYTRHDDMEDMWMLDTDYILRNDPLTAAQQFINQLQENQCDAFMYNLSIEALRDYVRARIKCGDKKLKERIQKDIDLILSNVKEIRCKICGQLHTNLESKLCNDCMDEIDEEPIKYNKKQ